MLEHLKPGKIECEDEYEEVRRKIREKDAGRGGTKDLMAALALGAVIMAVWTIFIFPLCGGISIEDNTAVFRLREQGYQEIDIISKDWLLTQYRGCAGGAMAKFTATATNSTGQKTRVYICVDRSLNSSKAITIAN